MRHARLIIISMLIAASAILFGEAHAIAGQFKVLYSFCSKANCVDGSFPEGGLLMDQAGNLYGTTSAGGKNNWGTVYQLLPPDGTHRRWRHQVIHSFCGTSCKQ